MTSNLAELPSASWAASGAGAVTLPPCTRAARHWTSARPREAGSTAGATCLHRPPSHRLQRGMVFLKVDVGATPTTATPELARRRRLAAPLCQPDDVRRGYPQHLSRLT